MPTIKPKCPHCGSDSIRACDSVILTNSVREWGVVEGELQALDFCDDGEVNYDSCAPHDPKRPWDCADCGQLLSDADLTKSLPKRLQEQIERAQTKRAFARLNGEAPINARAQP
jgi:hypothetical protein